MLAANRRCYLLDYTNLFSYVQKSSLSFLPFFVFLIFFFFLSTYFIRNSALFSNIMGHCFFFNISKEQLYFVDRSNVRVCTMFEIFNLFSIEIYSLLI